MSDNKQTDEFSMALCAIRYCIGRSSYIVASGVRWALEYGRRSQWVREIVIQDLHILVERLDQGGSIKWLGDEGAEKMWREALRELREIGAAGKDPT